MPPKISIGNAILYVMYLKCMLLSPCTLLSMISPLRRSLARTWFCRCKYSELTTAKTTIADAKPIKTDVALRYRGASVVGNSHLETSATQSTKPVLTLIRYRLSSWIQSPMRSRSPVCSKEPGCLLPCQPILKWCMNVLLTHPC